MAPKQKIIGFIKLQVPAGQANPSPPVGPALGQKGLNIMEFCKAFNAKTQGMEPGAPVPVIITAYADRTFTFEMKKPPVSYYLKKKVGIKSGHGAPNTGSFAGKITQDQIREIAEEKLVDMNTTDVASAMRSIEGSAIAMGLEIV